MRHAARLAGLAALAILASACVTSNEPSSGRSGSAFTIASVDVRPIGGSSELPSTARDGVQRLLDRYLDKAVVTPLRRGAAIADVAPVFTGPALERTTGPDRAALVDEGMPVAASSVDVARADAGLTALTGPDGVVVLAVAIELVVTADLDGTPLTIGRAGELRLSPDGDEWKISGYTIRVSRETPAGVTTTTAEVQQ